MTDSELNKEQLKVLDALSSGANLTDAAVVATQEPENMHKNAQKQEPYRRPAPKIGRNQACPCGSGKKHKRCCLGKPQAAAA
jgi:uncharacterized protein YecA (UPF0149 family)